MNRRMWNTIYREWRRTPRATRHEYVVSVMRRHGVHLCERGCVSWPHTAMKHEMSKVLLNVLMIARHGMTRLQYRNYIETVRGMA